jgi:mannose-6-phosphate isomerase-like protein (cupin superfamily)
MIIRHLHDCPAFTAGDNCTLREILHPDKSELALRYSLAHAVVAPGQTTWLHSLRTSEVYYITSGEGIMHIDGESRPVLPGDTVYIPPTAKQQITNTGTADLVFLCIVDPAWRKEDEEVMPSRQTI